MKFQSHRASIRKNLQAMGKAWRYAITPEPPKKLLFEHVPKCGGSTVREYLASQYPDHKIFVIGPDPDQSQGEFRALPERRRHAFDLVMGHGAHKLRDFCSPEIRLLTILRDPVDRMISHYYFARSDESHYLHESIVSGDLSLREYATSRLSPELRNNYVRRFTGIPAEEAQRQPEQAIGRALEVLTRDYAWVGLLDELTACLAHVAEQWAFPIPYRPRRVNVTRGRSQVTDIDQETLDVIRRENSLDCELYRRVIAWLAK